MTFENRTLIDFLRSHSNACLSLAHKLSGQEALLSDDVLALGALRQQITETQQVLSRDHMDKIIANFKELPPAHAGQ